MDSIARIAQRPTLVTEVPSDCIGVHESLLRAYMILEKVKYYLRCDVPTKIVLELIDEMEQKPEPLTMGICVECKDFQKRAGLSNE